MIFELKNETIDTVSGGGCICSCLVLEDGFKHWQNVGFAASFTACQKKCDTMEAMCREPSHINTFIANTITGSKIEI